ncbi:GNAT family N-acetyltransferase [Photobacterium galatheae]|uniref:GCN5 family acetyltransferase n=1 Tax=Photobacterium galatheae TaxID=1654360 RepID=A0A066RS63_9GAMM|nr:GNAT family N-acetyltransferase [Photobacterium galatheae]KDM93280.1 GCN5 family acetyltransferase [Photobacterium galatheae]MCM0150402.1 GNAT family N-acetyltransferase [Photobacterium galatheae]
MNEYLKLDLLTLEQLSKDAGKPIDEALYLQSLHKADQDGLLFECRKQGMLQGYFTLRKLEESTWFIPMFVVHPQHRNKVVFTSLFSQLARFISKHSIQKLVSNVLRNNTLSVNFHQRLGFAVTRENGLGYEFQLIINNKVLSQWKHLEKDRE